MGEMTIRLDDALRVALDEAARERGTTAALLAEHLLRIGLRGPQPTRIPFARALHARRRPPSPVSALELLDQARDDRR